MKNLLITGLSLALICLTGATFAQQSNRDKTVLTVENENISLGDFEAVFKKNNRDSVITAESIDEYMELFINFKLKVLEAKEEGLDTARSFQRELSGYRKQLARPYLIDNELLDELVKEAYDRRQYEVRASHILINCEPNASPADTLRAWNRIMKLRERILGGEDFASVATGKAGSEDPSARENKGDLGYFTSFQMVYPFETAAFNTAIGEISMPVRSRFGYHIVKTIDKRKAQGEIKVAHIMLKSRDNDEPQALKEVEARANEIYEMLQNGENFEETAMKYSQDASTARNGGELPWFGTGKMVEEFETASFNLEKDGDISKPIRTDYGWHIIKRLEFKPVPTFDEMAGEIRKKVSRDSRAEMTRNSFVSKLKAEYNVKPNVKSLKPLYKAVAKDDSTFVDNYGIKVKKVKKLNKPLFTLNNKTYSARDFYNHLNNSMVKRRGEDAKGVLDRQLDAYIETELMAFEDTQLERKYNDFRLLMSEYHDGILLFELTDRKVWSKAVRDTSGLESFYESNKERFMWSDRASAVIFACNDAKIAKEVEKLAAKGLTPQEIKDKINQSSALNVRIEEDTWERGNNEVLDQLEWAPQTVKATSVEGQNYVVSFIDVIPAQPKALDEARGMITAEYQNHLEREWIQSLRSKYTFKVNREVLHSLK